MAKIHTHYDNLMVARNAPAEVIRASYLALSKKFHPDVNPSEDASRIMKLINSSYDVLSNPEKRKMYDIQISMIELKMNQASNNYAENSQRPESEEEQRILKEEGLFPIIINVLKSVLGFSMRRPREALVIGVLLWWGISSLSSDSKPSRPSYSSTKQVEADRVRSERTAEELEQEERQYKRPDMAPNGRMWPVASGYIDGYKRLNFKGKSTIQVENLQNDNDFYVKLVDGSKKNPVTVRHVLIKGGDKFTFQGVTAGKYQLMYFDIDAGSITKSEDFEVQEIKTQTHIRASRMKITLYKVRNGNFRSEGIELDEFMGADVVTENKSGPIELSPEDMTSMRI